MAAAPPCAFLSRGSILFRVAQLLERLDEADSSGSPARRVRIGNGLRGQQRLLGRFRCRNVGFRRPS